MYTQTRIWTTIFAFVLCLANCKAQDRQNDNHLKKMHSNRLIKESSPYLLQHAHNPVDWFPWGPEAFEKAIKEDKPILLSVGYSSCHWCHVMERESFENEEIANVMNDRFVCIKLDREERPDIDAIYMDAVQRMGIRGGWPLNVFLTPDKKPFFGGTYYPPQKWTSILVNVSETYKRRKDDVLASAEDMVATLKKGNSAFSSSEIGSAPIQLNDLEMHAKTLTDGVDFELGGFVGAPKFPMPSVWSFLFDMRSVTGNMDFYEAGEKTLTAMVRGGIYDQIGGGFARYSTDSRWFAPHFEKMLYDNGQLLSLLAKGYAHSGNEEFRDAAMETAIFLKREMTGEHGNFYSALDADSEGEEGRFYVWENQELTGALSEGDFELIKTYYGATAQGNWEHGRNILFRSQNPKDFAEKIGVSESMLKAKIASLKSTLLDKRSKRIRPGLDDKTITSWNALTISGLVDSYTVFGDKIYLEMALANAHFLIKNLKQGENLFRAYKDGNAYNKAFSEDYALLADALISLYQITADDKWLTEAEALTKTAIEKFYDKTDGFFFFAETGGSELIIRKKELYDNVIPSSNAVMAHVLLRLGHLDANDEYIKMADKMLSNIEPLYNRGLRHLHHWARSSVLRSSTVAEVVIVGPKARESAREILAKQTPGIVILASEKPSSKRKLLKEKNAVNGKTTFYVCYGKTCSKPVQTVAEALKLLP
ncbi:hypothetical protein FUAX_21590 [Fulvitalea axinellae]|uniref:Spermatogenesis-associated protein 20-like TRX domain-containing protein n=1 Tax=Fulvitalea axinellae TaxID=1182444 RepID=A0AAU9CWF2_9BACT|nr:hypothetical protein FUAX_21590 [Fulvitalea axinellae]